MVMVSNAETVSMKQAKKITEEANDIMTLTAKKMEDRNKEFIDQISKIWEDQNAVDYMKVHKQNFEGFFEELKGNNDTFGNTVKNIADAFAKVAQISTRLALAPLTIVPVFDISKVLDHFTDGEGDEFGFKDVQNGPDQVMDAFNQLKNDLQKYAQQAVTKIQGINAFGNTQIQLNLAKSAGKIVEILGEHIATAESQIKEYVQNTANAYKKLGSQAETSANISSN